MQVRMHCMIVMAMVLLTVGGCNDTDQQWLDFGKTMKEREANAPSHITIETAEYAGGQLVINGTCTKEGEILLVLPMTEEDKRIIGSPRCSHGRYEVINATFGKPPCEISVEFGGDQNLEARVTGAEMYCH